MPDALRRGVLITRPTADAMETAALVAARGLDPVIAPVVVLRERSVALDGTFDGVVATSRNAIPALPERLRILPLLAVGSATAARAREAGFGVVLDADGDADALADLVRQQIAPGSRLLFAHGERQGDGLAGQLASWGYAVTRLATYAVVPARCLPVAGVDALEAGTLRAAMFLSAETAAAFLDLLPARLRPALSSVAAVAIGARAAAVLAPLPWQEIRVAFKPTLDDVLALL